MGNKERRGQINDSKEPFYRDGLRFSCTQCSNCCRFDPGYVFLSRQDVDRLTDFLGISKGAFYSNFCREINASIVRRISLIEKQNYDCIFWEDGKCTVYPARPLQCRTFPFWPQNLINRRTWDSIGKSCPGINHGKLYKYRDIKKILSLRSFEPFLT